MASDLGKAYIQIVPSAQNVGKSIETAIAPSATKAGATAGTKCSKAMGQRISALGGKFVKAGAIATAVSVPIINGIKNAMSAYEVQATAETKLTEIYKSRMGVSEEVAQKTMDLASAMQKTGVIGDEVTISGAQQLATFAKYPGTVDKLLPAMGNLLAQQKGVNATTDDAVNIGNLMGKVLQGQTGALKRVGISFTSAQEEVLKYGTEEERAAMLAEVINDNVGNMNEELAKTPSGQIQQLKNSLGDLQEEVGRALAPVLTKLANWAMERLVPKLEAFIGFIQKHPIIAKIAVALTGLLAIGGPLLGMIGAAMMIIPMISAPILGIVAAIAAAIAITIAIVAYWDEIKAFFIALWAKIKEVFAAAWAAIKAGVVAAWNGIKTAAVTVWNAIKAFFVAWISFYINLYKKAFEIIKTVVLAVWNGIKTAAVAVWNAIKTFFVNWFKFYINIYKTAFNAIKTVVLTVWNAIKKAATTIWNGIKTAVTAPVKAIKSFLSTAWTAIRDRAKNGFQKVKDAITAPIQKAKDIIKGIIDKIKGFFDFDFKLPDIRLPHFSISPSGWSIGDLLDGVIPSLGIDWYAKGGIFTRPTVAGVGDVRGGEAALPLEPFWKRMDAIVSAVESGGGADEITINVYTTPGMDVQAVAQAVEQRLTRAQKQRQEVWR